MIKKDRKIIFSLITRVLLCVGVCGLTLEQRYDLLKPSIIMI